ncbi:MAG: ABC transporter ATP-binding protein [Acidobacteria bacterium]|nr:MAG: ABC transporter ATP-binding protein [Acidobacteriota bacterium]REK07403.1 MAG: ABC transporter ATP-binding protein [Acidobacteriota bacterium]
MIEVRALSKHYGRIRAVDSIDFTVRRGDVLAFLGPNGAGKTTAMKMITGFLEPDAGTVHIAGRLVHPREIEVRRRIGYLPENAPAYGEMTVLGFLEFVADARQLADPRRAIDRVVELTTLGDVRGQTIETLSKGFKRRVGLAQALIHDPDVLILDEPTDGLDPNQKALVQDLLGSLAGNKAIVLSTHILDEAERICNRALILSQGRILVDATPGELMRRAPGHNSVLVAFRGEVPADLAARIAAEAWCERCAAVALPAAPGSSPAAALEVVPRDSENRLSEVLELVRSYDVSDVRLHEGRLDDLFREVTKGVAA